MSVMSMKSFIHKLIQCVPVFFILVGVGPVFAATITAAAGGGNWSAGGTWVGGVAPTAADDVLLANTSGNVTIDGAAFTPNLARSVDCTGYTGTLTQGAGAYLNIGDASGGSLTLAAGMTYVPNSSSVINFVSTTSGNTVTSAGKTLGNLVFNGVGGGWIFQDSFHGNTSSRVELDNGTLNTNAQTMTLGSFYGANSPTLTITNSSISLQSSFYFPDWSVSSSMTLNASGSTITLNGNGGLTGGGLTYNNLAFSSSSNQELSGTNTFTNLTYSGSATKTNQLILYNSQTVTGTLTLTGNSAINRLFIKSGYSGTAMTITSNGANTISNADFEDIVGAGTASWNLAAIAGNSGDCGGNSGITFTAPSTQYWYKDSAAWSTAAKWFLATNGGGGAGRVPLCQDDVVFDANSFSTSGRVVNANMPRLGKNINWTGVTNTPNWTMSTNVSSFGSVTMVPGMTTAGNGHQYTLGGRGAYTLTNAGQNWKVALDIIAPGGSITLQDDFNNDDGAGGNFIQLDNGTFNANNFNVTTSFFGYYGPGTATLNMGSGTWTVIDETGGCWGVYSDMTLNANTSTILMKSIGSTSTFSGGGYTYYNFRIPSDTIDTYKINDSNIFNTFTVDTAAQTVSFGAGSTQTISNFSVTGSAGNVITLNSQTPGSQFTLSVPSGVISKDYLSIQDSYVTGHASWYAGTHSTNVSNNKGWVFNVPPPTNALDISGS